MAPGDLHVGVTPGCTVAGITPRHEAEHSVDRPRDMACALGLTRPGILPCERARLRFLRRFLLQRQLVTREVLLAVLA